MNKRIKYLHLSDNFYPFMTGGTEIFIQQFINVQIRLSEKYEVKWACHKHKNLHDVKSKNLENYKIFLEPVSQDDRLNTFSFKAKEIPGFSELLKNFKPDIVHVHSLGSRTTLNHIEAIKNFGAKLIFTLHTPPCSCMGNLLYALGILLRVTAWKDIENSLPFLIGSLGTISLDLTILVQFM